MSENDHYELIKQSQRIQLIKVKISFLSLLTVFLCSSFFPHLLLGLLGFYCALNEAV